MKHYGSMLKVFVHELLEPEVYIRGRSALVELFKAWTGSPSEQRFFEVTPAGMIHFADHGELWRESEMPRSLPETPEQAFHAAERFLLDVRNMYHGNGMKRLPDPGSIQKVLQVCPIPEHFKQVDAVAVLHPRLGLVDHWLCRFSIEVEAFPWRAAPPSHHHDDEHGDHHHPHNDADHPPHSRYLPVHDALIEVRIGARWPGTDRYRVIAYNQRWRPVKKKGRKRTGLYPIPEPATDHGHEHKAAHEADHVEPVLVYVLDADSQRYLAPYYLGMSGHHITLSPASEYSMVLNTIQRDGPVSTDLFLDIAGGHRKHEFDVHWSYWRPDMLVEEGIVYMGRGRRMPKSLPHAVYNIIADVIDKVTGQTKRHQQMVFAGSLGASIRHLEELEQPVI